MIQSHAIPLFPVIPLIINAVGANASFSARSASAAPEPFRRNSAIAVSLASVLVSASTLRVEEALSFGIVADHAVSLCPFALLAVSDDKRCPC